MDSPNSDDTHANNDVTTFQDRSPSATNWLRHCLVDKVVGCVHRAESGAGVGKSVDSKNNQPPFKYIYSGVYSLGHVQRGPHVQCAWATLYTL